MVLKRQEKENISPSRSRCTQSIRHTLRTVTIRPQEQYEALKQKREQEKTKEFTQLYAKRAGIEGTISQGVRVMGLRRSRYIGQEKTHSQHVAIAAALNVVRCLAWFNGVPRAQNGTEPLQITSFHPSAQVIQEDSG